MVANLGMPGVHFRDLRHAGNIWASKSGTSTRDLMARMGHDDMRAALVYQRATSEADRRIAEQLSAMVQAHREGMPDAYWHANGTTTMDRVPEALVDRLKGLVDLRRCVGADDGNRTRVFSLGSHFHT